MYSRSTCCFVMKIKIPGEINSGFRELNGDLKDGYKKQIKSIIGSVEKLS